jgi:hypothetical protein
MRFYLKVIEPNLGAIADDGFDQVPEGFTRYF